MFRRPTVRYGDTPPAESRYMAARQIWDGRIGSAVVQAKNWRLAFFTTASLVRRHGGRLVLAIRARHRRPLGRPG